MLFNAKMYLYECISKSEKHQVKNIDFIFMMDDKSRLIKILNLFYDKHCCIDSSEAIQQQCKELTSTLASVPTMK